MNPGGYKLESELCRDFMVWARRQRWSCYAECNSWDILLVNHFGEQFGIQAKMRFSATLLRQVLPAWEPSYRDYEGPDYRGVLLPKCDSDTREALEFTGVEIFTPWSSTAEEDFTPDLDPSRRDIVHWCPARRHKLPGYIPDVAAGVPSPVQLTPWKIKALKVCARLELQGYITSKQIRSCGVDSRRWVHPRVGWLVCADTITGRYIRGPGLRFPEQHPEVYAKIKSETAAEIGEQPRIIVGKLRR